MNHSRDLDRRRVLWVLAGVTLTLAVYSSFLPMRFRTLAPGEATERFYNLPWYDLGIYRRADWVANGLIILLPSILASAAVDWGRKTRPQLLLATPCIFAGLAITAVLIEYFQAYTAVRTQSLNDMTAGIAGAALGPLVFLLLGRPLLNALFQLHDSDREQKFKWAIVAFILLNCAYSVMPLDVMLQPSDYAAKYNEGRLQLIPMWSGLASKAAVKGFALTIVRGAFLAAMAYACWGRWPAIWTTLGFAFACELIQVPIFTRTASFGHVVGTCVGIPIGIAFARWSRVTSVFDRAFSWILLGVIGLFLIIAGTLGRSSGWIDDPDQIASAWQAFFDWPLAKYYYTSEFEAGQNALSKLIVFAVVGFCFCIGVSKTPENSQTPTTAMAILLMVSAAILIELTQVYLKPHIADLTDILLYLAGATMGWTSVRFLATTRRQPTVSDKAVHVC